MSENLVQKRKKVTSLITQLIDCPTGEKVKIIRVQAGHHAKRRLANLGIIPGVDIIKKQAAPFRGPVEIIVKGSLLVIGRGLASRIIVMLDNSK